MKRKSQLQRKRYDIRRQLGLCINCPSKSEKYVRCIKCRLRYNDNGIRKIKRGLANCKVNQISE